MYTKQGLYSLRSVILTCVDYNRLIKCGVRALAYCTIDACNAHNEIYLSAFTDDQI